MVAFNESNSVPSFASRARPRVQGPTFATIQGPLLQRTSLEGIASHSLVLQGKSTSSPRRLHRADHSNQQFSILSLTDSSGAVVERVAYQAYGQPTFTNAAETTLSPSAKATRYSYTGSEWDPSLELHHFRAKWMSGVSGKFLSRDPIGYDGSPWSLYEALDSEVLVGNDPSGERNCKADYNASVREADYRFCVSRRRRVCEAWLGLDLSYCSVKFASCIDTPSPPKNVPKPSSNICSKANRLLGKFNIAECEAKCGTEYNSCLKQTNTSYEECLESAYQMLPEFRATQVANCDRINALDFTTCAGEYGACGLRCLTQF